MSEHTSFVICLRIMGKDLDPDQITERLGVEPDNCHRYGDLHPLKKSVWQYGRWQYGIEGKLGEPLNDLIDEILSAFECKEGNLKEITREFDAVLSIGMCYLTKYIFAPSLDISAENVKKIGDLGFSIDMAAYPSCEQADGEDECEIRATQ